MTARTRSGDKLKLFVSYSRHDSRFADELVEQLEARGFEVKIDRRDLPFGEKWQTELAHFIRSSDTVLWLISEHSVASKWCNWELDEVAKCNKRLVPLMIGDTPRGELPRQLGEIHILPANGVLDLNRDLNLVVKTLETDHSWLKEQSRLADRTREWSMRSMAPGLLLRGTALALAEEWQDRRPASTPAPGQGVMDLILASRRATTRRQRNWFAGSIVVTVTALALAGWALRERDIAESARKIATTERKNAVTAKNQARCVANMLRSMVAMKVPNPLNKPRLLIEACGTNALSGARVLWVDNKNENTYAQAAFGDLGAEIQDARGTQEAINFLKTEKYNLVISNYRKDVDGKNAGKKFIDKVHEAFEEYNHPQIEIIFFSSNYTESQAQAIKCDGALGQTKFVNELVNFAVFAIQGKTASQRC